MCASQHATKRTWYIYQPHWLSIANQLQAKQATFLKVTTAYSWELDDTEKVYIPSNTILRTASLEEVSNLQERCRHEHSCAHREVTLTPRSQDALLDIEGLWYVYKPHWNDTRGCFEAIEGTWLKRSTRLSQDLKPDEKLAIASGEVLTLRAGPRLVADSTEATSHAHAGQHREIIVACEEIERLRSKAPRMPLCRYFSADPDTLCNEIRRCFLDAGFGPGIEPPIDGGVLGPGIDPPADGHAHRRIRGGSELGLLLPHGAYCNSGFVAAHGFQLLAESDSCNVAIVIGNNHKSWHKFALCDQTWATPLGPVEPALEIVEALKQSGYPVDRHVHAEEHSIENQLPFLRFVRGNVKIVAVGVGAVDLAEAKRLAEELAALAKEHNAVVLGTTDFSHEGPGYGGPALSMREVTALTRRKDAPLLEAVAAADAELLLSASKGSSMCGAGSAAVFLLTCRALGLTRVEQHRYLVNTEVTPCNSTTGFASFSFQRSH